jgi:acetyl esterase/lipase
MATIWYNVLEKIMPPPERSFRPETIVYKVVGTDTLKMHVFKPEGWRPDDKRAAIVYFFGGGWTLGTPLQFYRECDYYAARGMIAVSVDYRIKFLHATTPDDSLDDARDAICRLRVHSGTLGLDSERIAVSGASAGGWLAAALANEEDPKGCFRPNLLILNYAVLDRLGEGNYPPILFLTGSEDPLIPLTSVKRFGDGVTRKGGYFELHVFEGRGHPVFYYRKNLDDTFYKVRSLTDTFLTRFEYLKK